MDPSRNLTVVQQEAYRKRAARKRNRRARLLVKLPYTFTAAGAATRWKVPLKEAQNRIKEMLRIGEITTLEPGKITHPQIYKKWD
jgi:hypothetical protein